MGAPDTIRFPRSGTRYINFAALCFLNWQAIPSGQTVAISYHWLLEDGSGAVYAALSGRKDLSRTSTVILTGACGATDSGRWKGGVYKLKLFVDDRKFGEASFEIFEDQPEDPVLGEWIRYQPNSFDWEFSGEEGGGVFEYFDKNNVLLSETFYDDEDYGVWGEDVLVFWTCEVRDNPRGNQASKTTQLWEVTLEEPKRIRPIARFLYNFQNEFIRREIEENEDWRMVGSSALWRRFYDKALRYRK